MSVCNQWEVVFDICTEARDPNQGSYTTRTDVSNQKVVVQAVSSNVAMRLVESMYGGPRMCVVKNAFPVR